MPARRARTIAWVGALPWALVIALGAGCSRPGAANPKAELIGRWVSLESPETVEFVPDGTLIVRDGTDQAGGRWKWMADDRLSITRDVDLPSDAPSEYRIAIGGGELLMTLDDTRTLAYRRHTDAPDKALEHFLRAEKARHSGQTDKAIEAYQMALAADPNFPSAQVGLGMSWLARERPDKALANFDAALALVPNMTAALVGRGMAHVRSGNPLAGVDDYTRALKLEPGNVDTLLLRAAAWKFAGQFDKALQELDTVLRLDPAHTPAWLERAGVRLACKEYAEAASDLAEVARLAPNNQSVYLLDADVQTQLGNYRKAVENYDRVLERSSENARIHDARAWLLATCADDSVRDSKQAVESARRACQITKNLNASYLATLAAALAADMQYDEAIKTQIKANVLGPQDDESRREGQRRLQLYRLHRPYEPPAK